MKCVKCQTDNNLKERTEAGGRCKNCNHPFAFDPQAGSKFTDILFNNSIQTISSENTLFFTPKQLWYFLEKRLVSKSTSWGTLGVLIILSTLTIFISPVVTLIIITLVISTSKSTSKSKSPKIRRDFARAIQIIGGLILVAVLVWFFKFSTVTNTAFFLFLLGIGLGIFLIYFGTRQLTIQHKITQPLQFKQSEITHWLSRWEEINGEVTNVLAPSREMSEPIEINSEVTAYSFDRVIVCDTAEIAQFLIANNFHFEHNCAVLSIDGYPQNIFSTVMQMLKQNPDLKVYAFHSATPRGVTMINELRNSPNWFSGNNLIIYDLGLLPRHVFPSKNMWILKSDVSAGRGRKIPVEVKQTLSKDELEWLEAGFYVELESFSPRKLLQVVSQGIAKTQAVANGYSSASDNSLDSGDDGIILIGIDDNNRNVGFFASDSFG
ncbi:MAG: hypothetical protein F6K17_20310 [Okeania sp. SIO3C4]|nr:hypothetical protein [Okeania sp. SIO3C4]